MKKDIKQTKIKFSKLSFFGAIIICLLLLVLIFEISLLDKFYPEIYIANVSVFANTEVEAKQKLAHIIAERAKKPLIFSFKDSTFPIDLSSSIDQINYLNSLNQAYFLGRTKFYKSRQYLELDISFNSNLDKQLEQIKKQINQDAIDSQILISDQQISATPSQAGQVLDDEQLKINLAKYLNNGKLTNYNLPTKTTSPKLSYQSALSIKRALDNLKIKPLQLTFKDQSFELSLIEVIDLLDLTNTKPSLASFQFADQEINIESIKIGEIESTDTKLTLDQQKMDLYLAKLAEQIDQPVVEPLFNFNGGKVTEFRPPQEGKKLDKVKSRALITQNLTSPTQDVLLLPVDIVEPKNKLTNELGIKEMIGRGVSRFAGSIPNRIFNIGLAASRINGVLIPPGETFSFNTAVGDISASSGYKQAYVIKSGRTVLDDGGGVCQVSTTLFRTVLNSGLPVLDRTAHAYRVSYYEQGFPPGLDATIFHPSVDFQFKNDTGYHILIQAHLSGTSLIVEFYGTSDGRVAKLTTPQITSQAPPPAELRQDDPTLPKGTIKQVDWAAWGASVVFYRTVTRGGETLINDTFRSNYRPWQAVYLVGTGG